MNGESIHVQLYILGFTYTFFQMASKAPKKVSKLGAGKKAVKGASAGKKLSAKKTALGSKKPALKSNKPGGKKGVKPSVKKPAPKMKSKSGKAMKK